MARNGSGHQTVTDIYNGTRSDRDVEGWKAIALSFFRACHELAEAIDSDGSIPSVIKRNARRLAGRRAILRLVADVDNTRKHGGRDPGKCHARLGEISWAHDAPPTMTILRDCPHRSVERFDVLASATEAISEWRVAEFLPTAQSRLIAGHVTGIAACAGPFLQPSSPCQQLVPQPQAGRCRLQLTGVRLDLGRCGSDLPAGEIVSGSVAGGVPRDGQCVGHVGSSH
jgi:hypothetical protein